MAAATVPSRARAHPRPPHPPPSSSSNVTYIRMILQVKSLQGAHLSPHPVQYSFRWLRASKEVKHTSAQSIQPETHAFSGRMGFYASVKRVGTTFVSDDSAEPLQTELILAATDPTEGSQPTPVANAAFDVAAFLHRIVQGGMKNITTDISFTAGITAGVVLSVKAIGENFLTPLDEDTIANEMNPGIGANIDQLERLKDEVRERDERIERLAASTEQLDLVVKQTAKMAAKAAAEDVVTLKDKVRALEQSNALLERERADSVRKVEAHVAHAARIKETYSRLAAWYNNLRNEHEELQKKVGVAAGAGGDGATNHREQVQSLEKERDELQAELDNERRQSKQVYSRNSALLESKAKTLAELGLQWESAQTTLKETEDALKHEKDNAEGLREAVEDLKKQLAERGTLLDERGAALTAATERLEQDRAAHLEGLENAKRKAEEDANGVLQRELDMLKESHQQEISRLSAEGKLAIDDAVEKQVTSMKADHQAELERSRKELEDALAQKHAAEVDGLRKAHEEELQSRSQILEQSSADARKSLQVLQEKLKNIQAENENLMRKETESTQMLKAKEIQLEQARSEASTSLQEQLDEARRAKDETEKNLAEAREKLLAAQRNTAEAQEVSDRARKVAEELETARAEIATLQKEKDNLQSLPPNAASDQSESVAHLEEELSKMAAIVKSEKSKRDDIAGLLATADSEHDELREMVTRLRSERDRALQELNRERKIVPNPRINIDAVQRGALAADADEESSSLSEERDKAIRELFRVRKNLNKQIKVLKSENLNLSQKLADVGEQNQSEGIKSSVTDHDRAVAELDKLRKIFPTNSPKSLSSQSGSSAEAADDVSSQALSTLASLRSEIEQLKNANKKLGDDARGASRKNSEEVEKLIRERDDILGEIGNVKRERDASKSKLGEKDLELASLSALVESSARKEGDLSRKFDEANHEKQKAVARSAALTEEITSLRESLRKASASAPSLEREIERIQKQHAETSAALSVLQASHRELSKAADEREEELRNEIARLESQVEQEVSSAKDLSDRLHQNEVDISRERSNLESELALRRKKSEDTDAIIENLKSRNSDLTEKLAEEQNTRETTQQKLSFALEEIDQLRNQVSSLETNEQKVTDVTKKIQAQLEQSDAGLANTRKQLELAESQVTEQSAELEKLRSKITQAEASRDTLEKEAIAAGGKSEAVGQELANLRSDLERTKSDLEQSFRDRDLEVNKVTAQSQKEKELIQSLQKETEYLSRSNSELQSKHDHIAQELRAVGDLRDKTESMLRKAHEEMELKDETTREISKECDKLRLEVSRLTSINEESQSSQAQLAELDLLSKQELASVKEELAELREDKDLNRERVSVLEQELSEIHKRIAMVQEESDEAIASAKLRADKEARKVADMRKELRTAKSMTDSMQVEVDQLRETNANLRKEADDLRESADNRDSEVLQDLINTRMELAYSEEETIRLRNKLKKLGQSSQGSGPFER